MTLRDRATQTIVGYYDGSWTTDRRRVLDLRKREVSEAHAARMRERCPRKRLARMVKSWPGTVCPPQPGQVWEETTALGVGAAFTAAIERQGSS
jgi:hypothetical protein